MNIRKHIGTVVIAILAALLTVMIYSSLNNNNDTQRRFAAAERLSQNDTNGIHFANLPADFKAEKFNFTLAAENTVPAVVHVTTQFTREQPVNPLYRFFFDERAPQQRQREVEGFGSGVIISSDGYIVTNHHVVKQSDELSVTLPNEEDYEAEIVGMDPATDLALLKIDATDLPHLKFGSSQDMKLGEWVLAVGNPFNIGTTVTAGIVSAKGRRTGVLSQRSEENQLSIESYIQTDAAVNKGNSGGALVNIEGELIGINAAIASPTGTYAGYSFAIPSEIARKVVQDIMKYGEVQRAVLGVQIQEVNGEIAQKYDLDTRQGAYIVGVQRDGAADRADIKPGDVVIRVDGKEIRDVADLQSTINNYSPGDEVTVTVIRDGERQQFDVTLRNRQGSTEIVTGQEALEELGAEFKDIDAQEKQRSGISHGVQVVSIEDGKLSEAGIREGFIVMSVNGKPVKSVSDLRQIYNQAREGTRLEFEGLYPGGDYVYVYQVEK
ncbi:MAG: Do family serine endopeptidase [Bacteroidales bacterium]|nr:Do family serine endopeptidase [Bacteroidales bacterium]MBS3775967.1 Do family serine endopeptidase [Bacteroidales bacterium]